MQSLLFYFLSFSTLTGIFLFWATEIPLVWRYCLKQTMFFLQGKGARSHTVHTYTCTNTCTPTNKPLSHLYWGSVERQFNSLQFHYFFVHFRLLVRYIFSCWLDNETENVLFTMALYLRQEKKSQSTAVCSFIWTCTVITTNFVLY